MKIFQKICGGIVGLSMAFGLCACSIDVGPTFGIDVVGQGEVTTKEFKDYYDVTSLLIRDIHVKQKHTTSQVDVNVYGGREQKVVVTVQSDLLQYLTVEATHGTLSIHGSPRENYVTNSIKVDVYGYTFDKIELACAKGNIESETLSQNGKLTVSGASDMQMNKVEKDSMKLDLSGASDLTIGELTADSLGANISGASDLRIEKCKVEVIDGDLSGASKMKVESIVSDNIDLNCSGASKLDLSGNARKVKFDLSGASALNGMGLTTSTAYVILSGSSKSEITANESLKVKASGASELIYSGDCTLEKELSGGSTVTKK